MKTGNRDLLVLMKHDSISAEAMEYEVDLLNTLLFGVESLNSFCIANEVIDINRYKIIHKPHLESERVRRARIRLYVCDDLASRREKDSVSGIGEK